MEFKDKLNEYIEKLGCSAKTISERADLSAATVSRYRSGGRTPEKGSIQLKSLVKGIVSVAKEKGMEEITEEAVSAALSELCVDFDYERLQQNFNILMATFSISTASMSRALKYDVSYLSRIRSGQRRPSDPNGFAADTAHYIVNRFGNDEGKEMMAQLLGCGTEDLKKDTDYADRIVRWLVSGSTGPARDYTLDFLKGLDEFDLNEYIRNIPFGQAESVPVKPQTLVPRKATGLKEMMAAEMAFMNASLFSDPKEPIIMYSDMPIKEMASDSEFMMKYMTGMVMLLKGGFQLQQIHNLDRSFSEMMLGLAGWIPLYMTGQVSPYYLRSPQNAVFLHFLKVSGNAALNGEAIAGYQAEGLYYLTGEKEEVAYYRKRAERLLKKAMPLMEIYRQDKGEILEAFLLTDSRTEGKRRRILSVPPVYTMGRDVLDEFLQKRQIPEKTRKHILDFADRQERRWKEIRQHSRIEDEILEISEEEFNSHPIALPLSEMFYEENLIYTYEEYQKHLELTKKYAESHSGYKLSMKKSGIFRNIQITIHEGEWAMVSKGRAPVIHFVIRHPLLRRAIENMMVPNEE